MVLFNQNLGLLALTIVGILGILLVTLGSFVGAIPSIIMLAIFIIVGISQLARGVNPLIILQQIGILSLAAFALTAVFVIITVATGNLQPL